jgi:hypothetical protein
MSPYGYYGLPPEARLRWSYFSFFSIWRQLENFQASMNVKFRFVISGIPWEGGFPWVRAEDARGRTPEGKDIISARFALLFPDISGLLDKAALDCRARNARRASMLDTSYVDIESIDNRELLQDEATRRCLFQARLPQRRVGGARFWHINV